MQTTNSPVLDPRLVKRERRAAFAEVSKMLPVAYRGLMRGAGLGHPEKTVGREARAHVLLNDPDFVGRGSRFLAGQFAMRLIRTRAQIEHAGAGPNALEVFASHTLGRFLAHADEWLEGFSIQAGDLQAKALATVEGELAAIVLASLAHEAESEDFEEGEFWPDVFRGIADADRCGDLMRGFQPVFLDHADEWRHVLRVAAGGHVLDFLPARATAH